MTTNAKVALGIVGAVAAGVAIGLLLAPETGKDMRKKIKKTAGDWADSLTHLFEKGKETLEEKGRAAKSSAEHQAAKMKESFS